MDNVRQLPKSCGGNRYVLVMCVYATCYPEAAPLHSTDAQHITVKLVYIFSHVGVPEEILTDQGANFYEGLPHECKTLP